MGPLPFEYISDLGEKEVLWNKTEARFHCHGPCRRTLAILHPPSKVGLKSTACLLSVPQGVQVFGCDSGGHCEAGCSGHKGWRLTEALEDGNSYGFGVRTNCLCLLLLVLISTLVRTASLGLGSLSCPSRGFPMPFLLCTDFVLQENEGISD